MSAREPGSPCQALKISESDEHSDLQTQETPDELVEIIWASAASPVDDL